MNAHTCGIDCKLISYDNGRVVHEMFPAMPNAVAGRYQFDLNRGMTRRQYRDSGQDETREVRVSSVKRDTARAMYGEYRIVDTDMGQRENMGRVFHSAGRRSIRRALAESAEFFTSTSAFDDAVELVWHYVNVGRGVQRNSNVIPTLERRFQMTIERVEVADIDSI